jgi:hyperosmotically inducible protein
MTVAKLLATTGLVALMAAPLASSLAAQTTQTTAKTHVAADDSTLQTRVETAIKGQPTLKGQDIDAKVNGGVVTLTGTVQSEQRKARAARAAHVAGVTRVDNQLTVDAHAKRDMDDKAGSAAHTAADKTGSAVKTAGSKTKDAVSSTGEAITDAWINTKIHSKMVDEATLKGSDINVDVNNHMVTLKGTVASAAGKARAEEIAKTTDGVTMVHNELTIGAKK